MPEGQYLGSRQTYIYTSDNLDEYFLVTDETLGDLAGTGLTAATTGSSASPMPKRFKPRIVHWEANDGSKRKRIICGKNDASLYADNKSATLTIDGIAGRTTGRVGEKMTYMRLGEPPADD